MVEEKLHFILAVCCGLATIALLAFIGVALWPYISEIGAVLYGCICLACIGGILELASQIHHRHHLRKHERNQAEAQAERAWLHSRVIEAANIAAYVHDNNHLYHLSAYEENAKVFPLNAEEVTGEIALEVKRLAANEGLSERVIAGRLNISVHQVRKLLGKPRSSKKEQQP